MERKVIYNRREMLDESGHWNNRPGRVERFGNAIRSHEKKHGVTNPWELDFVHYEPLGQRVGRKQRQPQPKGRILKLIQLREQAAELHLKEEGKRYPWKRNPSRCITKENIEK